MQYEGRDLEAMSFAGNYHRWIRDVFRPALGGSIVEVGAGTGDFSELLLETSPRRLILVEPSTAQWSKLESRFGATAPSTEIRALNGFFGDVAGQLKGEDRPDSIVYVNVMEHVEDDQGEMTLAASVLQRGGRLLVFVPALPWLYGRFDKRIGHFRRYTRRELVEKAERAGFTVRSCRYFDLFGILPWFVKYRLLRSDSLEPRSVALFDRLVVPISRWIESRLPAPIGKNLLLVCERS
jgi:SAM-dependent methyltransferase